MPRTATPARGFFVKIEEFFALPATELAPRLLGWDLVFGSLRARLVETEAYRQDDPGCHAHRGPTPRNRIMFDRPGLAYVYFTYGTHWMLNVVAEPEGVGAAVLVRAAQPLEGVETMFERRAKARSPRDLLSGPGKLSAAFGIDGRHCGVDLFDPASELRLEPGPPARAWVSRTRIGLSPGKGDDLPWRFLHEDALEWVSRR